jgi:hypothetical protein
MNKKRLIHGFATIYIVAAILIAHSALVAVEATAPNGVDCQTEVGAPPLLIRDHQRLVEPDPQGYNRTGADRTGADRARPTEGQATQAVGDTPARPSDADRAGYTIRLWTSTSCSACQKYKRRELPALLKMGYEVEVLDYDTDDPPDDIRSLPTVQLIYQGEVIESGNYWKAKDIDKYVANHSKMKDK